MPDIFKGKAAMVTGGAGGIGREISLALAVEGAAVVVNDPGVARDGTGSSVAPADEVVREIRQRGGRAIPSYESVAGFDAARKTIDACVREFGRLDILVNTAGILRDRMIFNMTEEDWDAVLKVHLKGTFNTSRHACVIMREQKAGRIVNFTSSAWLGTVGHVNYGAAKGGIVSLTRSIAREMGRYGVTCNAIAPLAGTRMMLDEDVKRGLKARLDAGLITPERFEELMNMPSPATVAPVVLYLATEEAGGINGQVIGVSGGRVFIYSEPVETKSIYKEEGFWSLEELRRVVPKTLAAGLVNPAPPQPGK